LRSRGSDLPLSLRVLESPQEWTTKGSRNKLGEDLIADLQAHWEKHGADAIGKVFAARPDIYLKVVASLVPKEANVNQHANGSDIFLKLLERVEERGKLEQREQRQLLIDRAKALDMGFSRHPTGDPGPSL
jgi:hypothetical protein